MLDHLLAEHGDLYELNRRVDADDYLAAEPLASLYAKQGRAKDAKMLRRFGLNPDGSIADAE